MLLSADYVNQLPLKAANQDRSGKAVDCGGKLRDFGRSAKRVQGRPVLCR